MKFSFIIPTYGEAGNGLTEICLASLRHYMGNDVEAIVVLDGVNSSVFVELNKICMKYHAKLTFNTENSGFAKTVNKGIEKATGDIFVLTNNDIVFTKDIRQQYYEAFTQDSKLGIVGGLLYYPNKTIQHGGVVQCDRYMFTHEGWHREIENAFICQQPRYIIAVTGALFAIRKEMVDKVGYLDDKYFLASEDVQYCLRAWLCGWKVFYHPAVVAIHAEGATRGNDLESKMKKGAEWLAKEKETHRKFEKYLQSINLHDIYQKVDSANNPIKTKILDILNKKRGMLGIKRMGAKGDVILLTGIIKLLRIKYKYIDINICTASTDVFENNPNVNQVTNDERLLRCDYKIDLDLCYEMKPKQHIIDSYSEMIFGSRSSIKDYPPQLYPKPSDRPIDVLGKNEKFIAVHMAKSWSNRTMSRKRWEKVVDHLVSKGFTVVCLGAGSDISISKKDSIISLVNKTTILQAKRIIEESELFIGMDSGLLHVAQTTKTNILGIFTCVRPDYRLLDRPGCITESISPELDCRYCLERQTPPVTFVECHKKKKNGCCKIDTDKIIEKIEWIIKNV